MKQSIPLFGAARPPATDIEIVNENVDPTAKHFEQRDEGLPIGGPDFAEYYVGGELALHLHLRCSRHGMQPVEFCAVLVPLAAGKLVDLLHLGSSAREQQLVSIREGGEIDCPVLVTDTQLMDDPENVLGRPIPTHVWLNTVDECDHFWMHTLQVASPLHAPLMLSGIYEYWEFIPPGWGVPVRLNELPDCVVECGSQEVNNHSGCNTPLHSQRFGEIEPYDVLSRIRVEFDTRAVRAVMLCCDGISVELEKVLLCCFHLCLTGVEGIRLFETIEGSDVHG
jgi:hypothetical protein